MRGEGGEGRGIAVGSDVLMLVVVDAGYWPEVAAPMVIAPGQWSMDSLYVCMGVRQ